MSATQPAPASTPPTPRPRSRWRRWRRRLLVLLVLLLVGVWFAPGVVANTGLRNRFARQALAGVKGSVDVGGASLGWLSPVELRDVTIKDEAGRVILSVPKVTSQKSLVALLRNRAEPGEFTLERPTVAVVCEKNTTNLETALAEYLKADKAPAPTRTPVSVRVTGGTLTLTDPQTNRTSTVEDISAAVNVPASRAEPVTAKLTAATGNLVAEASVGETGSATLTSSGLPLDAFAPLLRRLDPGLSVAGVVTTDLRLTWGTDAVGRATFAVAGTASGKQLAVTAPWLEGDTLRLDSAELPLDVELAGRTVRMRKFNLTCDVGTISAAGEFDPDEPLDALLSRPGATLNANVELAKLAGMLPRLLRLKEGTELREGKLEVKLASRADAGGVVWDGKLHTSALKATRDGKPIAWEEPLHVEFSGRYASGQIPTFERLVCTSDFVALQARTTPETVQAAANVYLHRLGSRLAEFADLGGVTLDGEASATLVGRRAPDGAFTAIASVELKNFAFTDRAGKGLKEPALALQVSAAGAAPQSGPVQLKTATAVLSAGGDELRLSLVEPVADVRKLSSGGVDVRLAGDVARWRSRAGSFIRIPPYQMSGRVAARGQAKFSAERLSVERLTVELTNAKFHGAGLDIDEPTVNASGDLTFARATRVATVTKFAVSSAPLSFTGGTLSFEPQPDGSLAVSGNAPCVSDLNRLGKTLKLYVDPREADAIHGRAAGPVRFRNVGELTTFGGTLDVTNFVYGRKEQPDWSEPTLRLEADGDYRDSTDAVTFAVAKVERPGLALDAKGVFGKVTTAQDVNLSGTLRYDWAKLAPRMRELLGGNFTASGSGTRSFALAGRLDPGTPKPGVLQPPTHATTREPKKGGPITLKTPTTGVPAPKPAAPAVPTIFATLDGDAALGWDSIKAYGFDVDAGELKGKLTRGVLSFSPLSASFGGGRVAATPTLHLGTSPGELTLAKGVVVDRAKLTPQATAGALGYALPAIANAGQAEGEISATIDDSRIPLGDFTRTNLKGTLVIHKATVGASPVVAEVAKLLGARNTTMTLASETAVPVQVADGRVHHQNFAINLGGTTIRTSGSVGFDDTLDLVAEVPIPANLPALKNNPLLMKAVAGKTVRVPVRGTLSRPALDPKAFEASVVALAREGAKDLGKEVIEAELRKLFPNMPGPGANPRPGGGLLPFPFPKKP